MMIDTSLMNNSRSLETPEKKQNEAKSPGKSGMTKKQIKDKID
jgi:hypothetical protein